jgi:dienelactone hydrolase
MIFLPGAIEWSHPPYSKADSFREREVTVGDAKWVLPGTLTVPVGNGPFPGIVLVHGSGPNDRDETVLGTKVFKDLAEGLASRGIAVLRYEKRTKQFGGRAGTKDTLDSETIEDAAQALKLIRTQPEVDPKRVFLLGHSLGGYAAPRIAEDDSALAGLVLLAANARPLEDVMVEQSENLGYTGKRLEGVKIEAQRVKELEHADRDAPQIMGAPVSYWLDLKGYDATALAKKLTVPMLILQGERDYQISMKDFALWKTALAGRKDVVLKSYPALNHLFVPGEGKSSETEYRKPGHVAPEVIEDVAKWITEKR